MNILNLKSPTLKFSVSGMRGIFPDDLNAGNIPAIVSAFSQTIKKGDIAIARDNRPTGEAIENMVAGILMSLGRNVHRLGLLPTPTIKAWVNSKKLAGGIMISASHNPVEYTAFKFIKEGGFFFEAQENEILTGFIKEGVNQLTWGDYRKQGKLQDTHIAGVELHVDAVLKKIFPRGFSAGTGRRKIRVAIDTLGACANSIAPLFLEKLNIEFVSLFPEVCYFFPRPPEPVPASLKKLGELVVREKCDIGFAFDPDADRLAIVGPDGIPIGEELTLPIAMLESLNRKKGNVVVNLSSSLCNEFAGSQYGCKVFRSKVGEANVVELMKKKKAVFGGEGNGGVIDPQIPSFGRDSISGMAWILAHMERTGKSIPEIVKTIPSYYMKKEAIKGDVKSVKKIADGIKKKYPKWNLDNSDGFHFLDPQLNGWIHIRPSNTEPIIRIIAEASDKKLLAELLKTAGV